MKWDFRSQQRIFDSSTLDSQMFSPTDRVVRMLFPAISTVFTRREDIEVSCLLVSDIKGLNDTMKTFNDSRILTP